MFNVRMSSDSSTIVVDLTSPSSGRRRSISFIDCVADSAGLGLASLFGICLVGDGGFVCPFFIYSSTFFAFMWLSNISIALFNRALTFSATCSVHASIAASILLSRRASTVSSSDASPLCYIPGAPSSRVLFCSWSVATLASSSLILSTMSLSTRVPSRCV
jgi:hypothetical protein